MSDLLNRFDKEIEKRMFNVFEMRGFMGNPKLALKAGMAMGYEMALNDIGSKIETHPARSGGGECRNNNEL